MVFSSLLFVFLFLTLNLVCYYSVKTIRQKNIVLLVFSLIFYAWGGAAFAIACRNGILELAVCADDSKK